MKKENKNVGVSSGETLHIFCFDSINLKDKTNFDSSMVEDVQVAYWADDEGDIEERFTGMFDILFKEVIKNRDKKKDPGIN